MYFQDKIHKLLNCTLNVFFSFLMVFFISYFNPYIVQGTRGDTSLHQVQLMVKKIKVKELRRVEHQFCVNDKKKDRIVHTRTMHYTGVEARCASQHMGT